MRSPQFNRSLRLKARKMGYSLNQRGLYKGVIRDAQDRNKKLDNGETPPPSGSRFNANQGPSFPGKLVASETEQEIFRILGECAAPSSPLI